MQSISAQLVARMEVNSPIPGACNYKSIYALIGALKGQVEPVSPMTKEEIQKKLQNEVTFLKQNPKFKGKLMINCIINCTGVLIRCTVDNKSGNDELDKEVLAVFNSLTKWHPGQLNGQNVDSTVLYDIRIKKGVITIE